MPTPPPQPIITIDGVRRFQRNEIVRLLLDQPGGLDLNQLARLNFSVEDWRQFYQLIGYSVSGYGDLQAGASDPMLPVFDGEMPQARAVPPRMDKAELWRRINAYAEACGGDNRATIPRMNAVAKIEAFIEQFVALEIRRLPDRAGWWWCKRGTWGVLFVGADPLGHMEVVGTQTLVADFECDEWGERCPAPDEVES